MKKCGRNSKASRPRRYTLMIIPEKSGTSKSICFSKYHLILPAALLTSLALFIAVFLIKYGQLNKTHIKNLNYIGSLESVAQSQDKQLEDYKALELELQSKITAVQELEKALQQKINQVTESNESSLNTSSGDDILALADETILKADLIIANADSYIKKKEAALLAEARIPGILPCLGTITSTFGKRTDPVSRASIEFHEGIDISAAYGTKIRAAADGVVVSSCYNGSYGNVVVINHKNGYTTLYGHNSKLLISKGQSVKKGDVIALMGSTGRSTGVHVHFEVLYNNTPINPYSIIKGGRN